MPRQPRRRSRYPEAKEEALSIRESAAAYGVGCEIVNVRQAKDHLSHLLDRAERGQQIIITSDGRPKAMIVRYRPILKGNPWVSHRALRAKTPIAEDSTAFIRKERDSAP